jgi:ABC-type uncharacterized transport system permease subunit
MAEPVSTSYATGSVVAVGSLSLLPGVESAVILGSFAGAVVFVLASTDLTNAKKIGFFVISFIAGILCASIAAALLTSLLPDRIEVSEGVGALVAAAVAVRLLLWVIKISEDPGALLSRFKGDRK